jgi:hypothetical protein
MKRVIFALVAALVAGVGCAQEPPAYTPGENPFQGDYAITIGQPVVLRVDILGVHLDDVTVAPMDEVRNGEKVRCEVTVAGANTAARKAELTAVLLLEDGSGNSLERVSLDAFKVKSGKEFRERQRVPIEAATLTGAKRVYVFVQVAF